MNEIYKTVCELISAAVGGDAGMRDRGSTRRGDGDAGMSGDAGDMAAVDWNAVYSVMKLHRVAALAAPFLTQLPLTDELRAKWKRHILEQRIFYDQLLSVEYAVSDMLSDLPAAVIKGTAAAVYYPDPMTRTMGDIDILVAKGEEVRGDGSSGLSSEVCGDGSSKVRGDGSSGLSREVRGDGSSGLSYHDEARRRLLTKYELERGDESRHTNFRCGNVDIELHKRMATILDTEKLEYFDSVLDKAVYRAEKRCVVANGNARGKAGGAGDENACGKAGGAGDEITCGKAGGAGDENAQGRNDAAKGASFMMLPKTENGLVILMHIFHHLQVGVGLRQVTDWFAFLSDQEPVDWVRFNEVTRRVGIYKFQCVLTRMCEMYFGLGTDARCGWSDECEAVKAADGVKAPEESAPEVQDASGVKAAGKSAPEVQDASGVKAVGKSAPEGQDIDELADRLMDYVCSKGNLGQIPDSGYAGRFAMKDIKGNVLRRLQLGGMCRWKAAQDHKILRPFAWAYQIGRITKEMLSLEDPVGTIKDSMTEAEQIKTLISDLGLELVSMKGKLGEK